MPTLKERIQAELHQSMRDHDAPRTSGLRMLTSAIKYAEIDAGHPLGDEEVLAVISKQAKQRRESITEFRRGGREDLVAKEEAELALLETYLPAQAAPSEIEAEARRVIAEVGATGPRDIGRVMPVLVQRFAGRADGRLINETVRALLG